MKIKKNMAGTVLTVLSLLTIALSGYSQSCANYSALRNTGITYSSINSSSNIISSWRGQVSNQDDDNRSYPVPIGFDFWYLGTRYTTVNVNVNGFIDFSTSSYDGNWPANDASGQPSGYATCGGTVSYREDGNAFYNIPCGNGSMPNSYDGTYWALAPMYSDLFCKSANSLSNSIRYKTTGIAPNRSFTVEYINMDDKSGSSPSDYNFQIKLFETTGIIKFLYGNMTSAPGSPTPYVCGINGLIQTNPPASSELLAQQSDNSGTFLNIIPGKRTITPASNSKLTFTPPVPSDPSGGLTFSAITNSVMTLNWTDWASNENGYAIYSSSDGIIYSYMAQVAANSNAFNASNLTSGTTYYWKVYAVTEGCLSAACSGIQATLPAGTYTSVVSGNWSSGTTWDLGSVPTIGDNVIIANGHNVTVDGTFGCYNLTIGQGSSGKLILGNSTTGISFTVTGDIKIKGGAALRPNTTFSATHTLTVSGNIINYATLNMRPSGTGLCNVIFNKNGNQSISGTGGTTNFNLITIDMGNTSNNILDVKSNNFTAVSNFLSLINGTFKLSVPSNPVNLDVFSTTATISNSCGIIMNSTNAVMNIKSTLNYLGNLTCNAGTINIGDQVDESILSNGATILITGGTVNIAGRLDRSGNTALTNLTISGGNLILNTIGSTSATSSPFMIDAKGSSFNMTAGNIIIRKAGSGGAGYYNKNCSSYSFSGGTLMIGDGLTPVSQNIDIATDQAIAGIWINSFNGPAARLTSSLTVYNNVEINTTASFDCNSMNLNIGGTLNNDGTFISGNNTLTFDGSSAQQITGTSTSLALNDLFINNSNGDVSLNYGGDIIISGTLGFGNGKIILNSNNIIVSNGTAISGFNNNRYIVTNGTSAGGGYLQINNITASRDFPIGTSIFSYSPVLNFVNNGTADNFQARVYNGVIQSGLSSSNMTNNVVNKTWVINEITNGGSLVDMKLQWDSTAELSGFLRANCGISYYDASSSSWDTPTAWGAATANPSPNFTMFRNAISSFPSFMVNSGATGLPIELVTYQVNLNNNNQTIVYWETASEINNDYFTIEYATNLINFNTLAIIKGAGYSNQRNSYSYTHLNPLKGINYYRIRQTDYDGKEKSYPVKSVYINNTTGPLATVNFHPDQKLILQINDLDKWPADIMITDTKGSRILHKSSGLNKSEGVISLDCSALRFGLYYVIINQNGKLFSAEFMKE